MSPGFALAAIGLVVFASCAASPSDDNIPPTPFEISTGPQDISSTASLPRSAVTPKNISNIRFPSQEQTLKEAGLKNNDTYKSSLETLASKALSQMSAREIQHLAEQCSTYLPDPANPQAQFRLSERNLACAPWWLETRWALRKQTAPAPRTKPPSINVKNRNKLSSYKNVGFNESLALIKPDDARDLDPFVSQALKLSQPELCSYRGAVGAVWSRLEAYVADSDSRKELIQLYDHLAPCLKPDEAFSENIHMRMGLTEIAFGYPKKAKAALTAALAVDKPQESSRTLFWLGALQAQADSRFRSTKNSYWQRLRQENPIAYSAVVATHEMGLDPMKDNLVPDNTIPVTNRSAAFAKSHGKSIPITDTDLELFVFDILFSSKKTIAAERWADFVWRSSTLADPPRLLYWAMAQQAVGNVSESIFTLSRYYRYAATPSTSPKMLKLIFPKMYTAEILKSIPKDMDPILVLSLMRQESAFDAAAISSANARGLMQILPSTAKLIDKRVQSQSLFNPDTNIRVGSEYLKNQLLRFDSHVELALAAYNAGPNPVERWTQRYPDDNMMLFSDLIPYKETRLYVSIIMRNQYWYLRLLENQPMKRRHEGARLSSKRIKELL